MSLLGYDGFEGIATANALLRGWTLVADGVGAIARFTSGGVNGNRLELNSGGASRPTFSTCSRLITATTELIVGMQVRVETTNTTADVAILQLREGSTVHLTVSVVDTGAIRVYRGDPYSGTLLSESATGLMLEGTWNFCELYAKVDNTLGAFEVLLEGESVLSVSGIDTRNGGASGFVDGFRFCASTPFGVTAEVGRVSFDDAYWLDTAGAAPYNTFLGPVRIDRYVPNADAAVQFTPATPPDNYAMVNEALPDGETGYTESGTSGHQDVFGLEDLSTVSGIIFAVQTRVRARRTDAAAISLIPSVISDGVETDGATHALGADYAEYSDLYPLNPDGDVPWNDASFNALQVAYRIP